MPLTLALAAALAAAGSAAWTVPSHAGDVAVAPPVPTVLPANEDEKKRVFDALGVAAAEKSEEKLVEALVLMRDRKHDDFVPEVRRRLFDDDQRVQAAAIFAAASQGMRDAEKDVRKILRTKPKKSTTGAIPGIVATACIDYLARLEIAGEGAAVLDDQLKPLVADERRMKQSWAGDMLRASLLYLGKTKHRPAVPWLIEELLPEPIPANPNDPKNPPASYWEARHKLWVDYEGWTRWTLKEITGQEFRSVREWQAWLKQQDKKAFK